jgi:hypothetical protein
MSSVVVRQIWGALVDGRLTNAVSVGNDDLRPMIETSRMSAVCADVADCLSISDRELSTAIIVVFMLDGNLASWSDDSSSL